MDYQFQGKYVISGKILCKTGLHIGGTIEGVEIGGVDNIVVKDPLTDVPYIPGSSLKGKLRYLLEWELGKIEKNPKQDGYMAHSCGECDVCIIFGSSPEKSDVKEKAGPTRLTVRDCFPTGYESPEDPPVDSTLWKWKNLLGENIYTEIKTEVTIDRVTSEANPRPMERIPAGSEFDFEMLFDIYQEKDKSLLKNLFIAMKLLEESSLGGSGSRGYGKIEFKNIKLEFHSLNYYNTGKIDETPDLLIEALKNADTVDKLIQNFPALLGD